jgi:DNA recombination protein RmuC
MVIGLVIGFCLSFFTLITGIFIYYRFFRVGRVEQESRSVLGEVLPELVKSARDALQSERHDIQQSIQNNLKQQNDSFRDLTMSLRHEIDKRQREIHLMEEDRNRKYGELSQALTDYKSLTHELRNSTEQLNKILSNNQLRGSWGELQAVKIFEAAGMVEGTHYAKQRTITDHADLRPDFTIFLPNKLELHIDVKFPLQSLQQAMQLSDSREREKFLQQFGRDIKERMNETGKYILPACHSVDYVILFVPSESVFEVINRQFPQIIDKAFSEKIILTSPHSLFAVVRVILESYLNFHYEQNLREILGYLQGVLTNFERFKIEFDDVGRALQTAQNRYSQISETRYKQIARATDKMKEATQGNQIPITINGPVESRPNELQGK